MNDNQNQDVAGAARRTELRSRIRPLSDQAADEVFLPFVDLCFNWSMDKPRVEVEELLERDDAAFYFEDWGRNGDIAVAAYAQDPSAEEIADKGPVDRAPLAEESAPEVVGLAWLRLAQIEAVIEGSTRTTGYGWVAADIPELSLAVLPDHQSQGIGGMLLDVVCALAKMSGFPAVSLSVEDGNGAARLYLDHGFVTVGRNGASDILVRQLK